MSETGQAVVDRYGLQNADRRGDAIIVARRGLTGVVLLDRPRTGNAHTQAMIGALSEAWIEFDEDPNVRSMVMASSTDRFFCTGIDLNEVVAAGMGSRVARGSGQTHRNIPVLKPMITAVEGMVVGGGLHWVVEADIVVASEKAVFRDTHVEVGIIGNRENLGVALKAGLGAALYMSLIGKQAIIDAVRARELGMVQEVVPAGESLNRAFELADIVNKNSPSAMAKELRTLWAFAEMHYNDAVKFGAELMMLQRLHPDSVEGPRSFAEKREPNWVVGDERPTT
ncbi:MAG: enoyl-CoA hydratase/isomerase family protein [Acidimicrobiia bacterium]